MRHPLKALKCADTVISILRQSGGKAILRGTDVAKIAGQSTNIAIRRLVAAGVIYVEGGHIKRGWHSVNTFCLNDAFLDEKSNWTAAFLKGTSPSEKRPSPSPDRLGKKVDINVSGTSLLNEVIQVYNDNIELKERVAAMEKRAIVAEAEALKLRARLAEMEEELEDERKMLHAKSLEIIQLDQQLRDAMTRHRSIRFDNSGFQA